MNSDLQKYNQMKCYASREFEMTYSSFTIMRDIAYQLTGIVLSDHKQNMIYARLSRRLRVLGVNTFDEYCRLLTVGSTELNEFVNAITTNLTAFFREEHHFKYLKAHILPVLHKKNKHSSRLRIWSAGCSTGEEPYSIAMVLSSQTMFESWDAKILATDLDSSVVAKGREGVYSEERCASIPLQYTQYLQPHLAPGQRSVCDDIRRKIVFKELNLLEAWPMKGPFDIIFCRNVVIYFDKETQKKLFSRYASLLSDGGYLFIGHSENIHQVSQDFKPLGQTIYQKI
ncbi:CheR family methyltransferase [Marinagarivorans algicola]|uniref:CheR family methyltransferase n=1 Tax=Marinagarivorans algicola TaxID=1513270 RepID=UPI000AD55636|nr:protein-glutamate O-methyltransferase [Marinagarivorans algicola]